MTEASSTADLARDDLEAIRRLKKAFDDIKAQLARVIVGQNEVIEELLIAMFSRGHCMLEGVPGLAKTLMISTLAKCLSLSFSRIQFTPDLMPSDITGTEVIEENRSTGAREFKVFVKYPSFDDEFEIARRTTALASEEIQPVLSGEQILELQKLVRRVPVTDHVIRYTLALVRQTRIGEPGVPKFIKDWLAWGAGPRAVQNLIIGGKARALLYGRAHVQTDDIQALCYPVLRHRLLTN